MAVPAAFTVRAARAEDAPEIARLNLLFNGSDEPPERYASRLRNPGRVDTPLIALAPGGGRAVGIANLRLLAQVFYPEPYAELTELFVEEGFRRQGVGRALVVLTEQLARQAGAEELLILTGAGNLPAQSFYHALGYQAEDIAFKKTF